MCHRRLDVLSQTQARRTTLTAGSVRRLFTAANSVSRWPSQWHAGTEPGTCSPSRILGRMTRIEALDGGWGWVVVLSAHCMYFLIGGLDTASGVIYREILQDLQESAASTAGFSAVLLSAKYLCGVVTGVLCMYWSTREVMMIGGILACVGMLLSSFCRHLALIYLTLGLMTGIGNGLAYTSGLLAVNEYFSRRRATALGLATAGSGVGGFAMPLMVEYFINAYSYHGCMWILSGLSLNLVVCGALIFPLPDDAPTDSETVESEPSARTTIRSFCAQLWANFDLKLFLNPHFSVFAAAALFITAGINSALVVLPHHAQLRGLDSTTSVLVVSISGACETLSRLSMGLLFDLPQLVAHRRRIWSLGMLLTAVSVGGFAFMHSLASFVLGAIAYGLMSGMFAVQLYCILIDLIGRDRARTGLGLLIVCRGLGVALGPPMIGAIKDATGSYQLSFLALGLSVLVGFLLLGLLELAIRVPSCRGAGDDANLISEDFLAVNYEL